MLTFTLTVGGNVPSDSIGQTIALALRNAASQVEWVQGMAWPSEGNPAPLRMQVSDCCIWQVTRDTDALPLPPPVRLAELDVSSLFVCPLNTIEGLASLSQSDRARVFGRALGAQAAALSGHYITREVYDARIAAYARVRLQADAMAQGNPPPADARAERVLAAYARMAGHPVAVPPPADVPEVPSLSDAQVHALASLSEGRIEAYFERRTDAIDARFIEGEIATQAEYDMIMRNENALYTRVMIQLAKRGG